MPDAVSQEEQQYKKRWLALPIEFVKSIGDGLLAFGAYGHARLREFVFGRVIRSLLDDNSLNRFMAW